MKRVIIGLLLILSLVGCDVRETARDDADMQQQKITSMVQQEANNRLGLPDMNNFYEKSLLKDLYELRDDSELICHAYTKSQMSGKYVYEGMCIGYGLPYAVQYSNPQKYGETKGGQYGARNPYTMPQAEPNGLFMPDSLSATWLIMITEEGKREPAYYEPAIIVRQSKMRKELCEVWSLTENY